jgi:hypothetical protein
MQNIKFYNPLILKNIKKYSEPPLTIADFDRLGSKIKGINEPFVSNKGEIHMIILIIELIWLIQKKELFYIIFILIFFYFIIIVQSNLKQTFSLQLIFI